ncbi:MAG TPA: selenide, water dikinase SelD [Rectinemataceae bacterium]|nr:selenide, water dikinase SelD [Rectinemataceae bacterium]
MSDHPGLTAYTRFSGCGAKLGPGLLDEALCGLSQPNYPDVLADFSGAEDAGIVRITPDLALVQTVDFFPPIVDDPFLFGRIAAANALSDVYAMGGRAISALALLSYPVEKLKLDSIRAMMEGGLDALIEAGCALVGGHSIDDLEPKLGYAVTGLVHPERFWRNDSAGPGCGLILTKPIGTGLVNTALRGGVATAASLKAAEESMRTLNRRASELLRSFAVAACTDITGFGLAGHACEMAAGEPGVGLRISLSAVPKLCDIERYAAMGLVPEGTWRNRSGRARFVDGLDAIDPVSVDILFDPQTSGGLLAALPRDEVKPALAALRDAGIPAALIGETVDRPGRVEIVA